MQQQFSIPISDIFAPRPNPGRELFSLLGKPGLITFAGGLPDPAFFDVEGIRAAYEAVLTNDAATALQYSPARGLPVMREAAARRLIGDGIDADPSEILVTSGGQQAIALVTSAMTNPGDVILVEEPTYMAALYSIAASGARAVGVPSDDEGIDPVALAAAIKAHRPKLVYLIPTFQNPSGRTMSPQRRAAVIEVLQRHDVLLAEDDPYSELRFTDERPVPISADPRMRGRSVVLNTLSKLIAPGMRVGWVHGPEELLRAMTVAKQAADFHTSSVNQLAAAHYLAHTDLEKQLSRIRAVYQERRDAMVDQLAAGLPAGSQMTKPEGGMFTWVQLPAGFDTEQLLPAMIDEGVVYVPGAAFYSTAPDRGTMRLSFASNPPEVVVEGINRLCSVLERNGPAQMKPDKQCSNAAMRSG